MKDSGDERNLDRNEEGILIERLCMCVMCLNDRRESVWVFRVAELLFSVQHSASGKEETAVVHPHMR